MLASLCGSNYYLAVQKIGGDHRDGVYVITGQQLAVVSGGLSNPIPGSAIGQQLLVFVADTYQLHLRVVAVSLQVGLAPNAGAYDATTQCVSSHGERLPRKPTTIQSEVMRMSTLTTIVDCTMAIISQAILRVNAL